MAALPKPPARGPKPRKRIARTKTLAKSTIKRARSRSERPSYRSLVERADDLCRTLARARAAEGMCQVCLIRPWHDCMHGFIKGKFPHLRHDLDNLLMGCRSCHRQIDSDHTRKQPIWELYLGREGYEALRIRSLCKVKVDLRLVILGLEARVRALKG
jgi:hypothetical protein